MEAVFMGVLRRFFKTHVKTHGAADTAFGFKFHAFGFGEPFFAVVFVVVVFIDKGMPNLSAKRIFSSLRNIYSLCGWMLGL